MIVVSNWLFTKREAL